MGAAPWNAQGEASGLLITGRVIGQSMSVALSGTVFAASLSPVLIHFLVPTGKLYLKLK